MTDGSLRFSSAAPGKRPDSNTGQKCLEARNAGIVDYLTVSFRWDDLKAHGLREPHEILRAATACSLDLAATEWRDRTFLFMPESAVIVGQGGEVAGRMGRDVDAGRFVLSLSGAGCRYIDLHHTAAFIESLGGRITRCDVAYDDTNGAALDVHRLRADALRGDFVTSGRPPLSRFLDDHGSGKGCTLYVGSKGHQELCVYEKGKQLGDESSPWVRAEARLYAKHYDVPVSVLRNPLAALLTAYPYLRSYIASACAAIQRTYRRAFVDATAKAAVCWMRTQAGRYLHTFRQVFGEELPQFIDKLSREGVPARWRSVPAATLHLELRQCVSA